VIHTTYRDTERHRETQRDTERHRETQRDTERHRETRYTDRGKINRILALQCVLQCA